MTTSKKASNKPTPPLPADKDPALVAAGSTAAAALLGTSATIGLAAPGATAGAGPADALPPVAGSRLPVSPGSRYSDSEIATWTDEQGVTHRYIRRRIVPQPERLGTAGWDRTESGDRVDTLAARALGDPLAFWRLCDAAGVEDAAELEAVGRMVRVPLPPDLGEQEDDDG